jgi:uncharacterized protein (DUF58 family)
VQHREYVAGDDIRHLDWKVWSKTDRYYIKQFEEETNLRNNLVVDVSESMHYGRGPLNKYEYACTVAACLGYLLLRQQDSTGLMSFDSDVRQIVPPRSSNNHIDALVKAMDISRPREKTDILKILRRVAESLSGRSMVVIVSDLLVDREQLFKGLEMLCHRRHDILVFHVLDDDELTFPFAGTTRFEGMEEQPHLICDPSGCATATWKRSMNTWSSAAAAPGRHRLPVVRTGEYLDAVLSKFLHHRTAWQLRGPTAVPSLPRFGEGAEGWLAQPPAPLPRSGGEGR